MPKLYNLARMTTATTGTGTITLGVASSGFLTFAGAGVANADIVFYGIKDGSNSEVGYGTYTSSGTTLSRNVVKSTNSNAAINLSGAAEVYVTVLASDGGDLLPGFTNPLRGFDMPINLQLNASVASNILTIAIKGNNGSDPSNSNPVLVPFRDATAANGDPVWAAITSALSINTNATGASLGSANGTPFRFWVVLFNNAGTPVLGLINCRGTSQVFPLDETSVQGTTAIGASATSAGTFYTPNGTTLANCAFRILGYLEYASGLTTAGTYASAPTKLQLFGPGVKKPGEYTGLIAQSLTATTTTTSASSFVSTPVAATLALTAAMNGVEFSCAGDVVVSTSSRSSALSMFRGSTQVGPIAWATNDSATIAAPRMCMATGVWLDFPGATSVTYTVKVASNGGTAPSGDVFAGVSPTLNAYWKEVMG